MGREMERIASELVLGETETVALDDHHWSHILFTKHFFFLNNNTGNFPPRF
jgi:hypothetical protein